MQSIAHNCALIRFIQFQVSIDNKPEILLINMERHHTRLHMCSNALEQIQRRTMTTKGPFGMAPAREKTALALARMEKQFVLALVYFVRKRLAK